MLIPEDVPETDRFSEIINQAASCNLNIAAR